MSKKRQISPKDYVKQTGDAGEISYSVDDTLTIWQNKMGFYWVEKFHSTMSVVFFDSEDEAEANAREEGMFD